MGKVGIILTTACEKKVVINMSVITIIPKGTEGSVIDIIIEDGKVQFLLEFANLHTFEYYSVNEVEERF